ncbi:MAG: glycine/sarcosine/betaine reductase component B subunit, partial [Clostridia bacterium]|nr:glycine/sarcosine/betaine reductase component B subunit [Clostridia bacterium]
MQTLKLELGYIQIKDIKFSKECKVENGTLYVDPEVVKDFMYQDDDVKAWVKDFRFD